MRGNAGIIGPRQWPTQSDADGSFHLVDVYNQRLDNKWPISPGPAPTGVDTETAFVGSLPTRMITVSSSGDYTGNWDVGEIQTSFSGTGRLYLAAKVTSSPTYRNDIAVAGVQILSSDKSTLEESWIFSMSSGQSNWSSIYSQISGSSSSGLNFTPSNASGYSYYILGTSANRARWSLTSYTSSTYTGMADGISGGYDSSILSLGTNQISQQGSTYYAYREASGSTRYSSTLMRSPSRSWSGDEWIRIAYGITGPSGVGLDYTDSLFVGTY
jgi:hypothetical protein